MEEVAEQAPVAPAEHQALSEQHRATPWHLPAPSPANAAQDDRATPVTILAGLAWVGAAIALGYLALLQLQYASLGPDVLDEATSRQLGTLALWNGISAAVTLAFGAKIVLDPSRRSLLWSALWGGLNVAWGVGQIFDGASADAFLIATLLSGVAAVLSIVARQQLPPDKKRPPDLPAAWGDRASKG